MDRKVFQRFIDRDRACYATGIEGPTLVPQHRLGGMGGNRRETPSSILTFDSITNGLIETDSWWQQTAYRCGWKLRSGDDPLTSPAWHAYRGWLMLDDDFHTRLATPEEVLEWQTRHAA